MQAGDIVKAVHFDDTPSMPAWYGLMLSDGRVQPFSANAEKSQRVRIEYLVNPLDKEEQCVRNCYQKQISDVLNGKQYEPPSFGKSFRLSNPLECNDYLDLEIAADVYYNAVKLVRTDADWPLQVSVFNLRHLSFATGYGVAHVRFANTNIEGCEIPPYNVKVNTLLNARLYRTSIIPFSNKISVQNETIQS